LIQFLPSVFFISLFPAFFLPLLLPIFLSADFLPPCLFIYLFTSLSASSSSRLSVIPYLFLSFHDSSLLPLPFLFLSFLPLLLELQKDGSTKHDRCSVVIAVSPVKQLQPEYQ
jgi:hypothetical protein